MPPSTRLETERLILRVPTLEDLDRWAELMADANAARFIGGVMPKPVVWRMIMQMVGAWDVTGVSMFSVVEKLSARLSKRRGAQPEVAKVSGDGGAA